MRTPLAAIATAVIALAAPAVAQDAYPSKPVRFIVPFPATGPLDVMARLYAQKLGERWGKNVIAENRPGATGTIGADAVAKAAPDGYTLLFTVDLPIVMAPALMKPPYDPKTDLVPVAAVGETMNMLVVHPSAGVSTLAELVAAAKAKPGALTFSSAGNASPGHLCVEMLKSAAGVDFTHVPYKGAAPAMQAALAGEVSMFCGPITQGLPHVKSGKLRALGVTGAKASPLLPELNRLRRPTPVSSCPPGMRSLRRRRRRRPSSRSCARSSSAPTTTRRCASDSTRWAWTRSGWSLRK
jgi:tripartite-type tricarboxylate transporter receptor subunit TctC